MSSEDDIIILVRECENCNIEFEDEYFEYDEIDICKSCMKNVKNKCETCGKLGRWNFNNSEYGIRCKVHKDNNMIDTMNTVYSEKRFVRNIEEKLGGKIVGEYKGNIIPVKCICKKGHICNPIPGNIQQDKGMCKICAGQDSETAKNNFINSIEEKLRGKVVGEYKGNYTPVDCICQEGHKCNPRPSDIQQDKGMCRICAGNDPETSKNNFINTIEEKFKGKVVGEYKGCDIQVKCICKEGHKCNPTQPYTTRARNV